MRAKRKSRPSCEVIAFPLDRLTGHVRRCADAHETMGKRDLGAFSRRTVNKLHLSMLDAGIQRDEIDRQLQIFTEKVRCEVLRRRFACCAYEPDEVA